jgi:hypothetical protein
MATSAHGLAALYLGFSVAFVSAPYGGLTNGSPTDSPEDPNPNDHPATEQHARIRMAGLGPSRRLLGRCLGLLFAAILLVDDPARTSVLAEWMQGITAATGIWFAAFPLAYTIWPKKQPPSEAWIQSVPDELPPL